MALTERSLVNINLGNNILTITESLTFQDFSHFNTSDQQMSRNMIFPTMWYMRPAKPQISLRIRAV